MLVYISLLDSELLKDRSHTTVSEHFPFGPCQMLSMHYLIAPAEQPLEVSTIIIPILQMREMKLRELKSLFEGHTAYKKQSQDSNQGGLSLKPILLITAGRNGIQ